MIGASFPVLAPDSQILFAAKLDSIRSLYFDKTLSAAVAAVDLALIDAELHQYVSPASLSTLAQHQLRGEAFYPVPCLLEKQPFLLGYYRLLYGISQKQFYKAATFSRFRKMESSGVLSANAKQDLAGLCASLAGTADALISTLPKLSRSHVYEMQIMTLGVQLDGGKRNIIGQEGVAELSHLIRAIIPPLSVVSSGDVVTVFTNAAGRKVTVSVAADPDVSVVEEVANGLVPVLAIEVKAGTDASNRLNRLGEAEKSHLKAKARGHTKFWTVVRVPYTPAEVAANSPTTQACWQLDNIKDINHSDHTQFVALLKSYLGVP